jgi:hypothetical protein
MPGLNDIPKWFGSMSYLAAGALVLGGVGAAAGGFVEPPDGGEEVSPPPQPASTPKRPSSTIRVDNLFIVGATVAKWPKRTSKKIQLFLGRGAVVIWIRLPGLPEQVENQTVQTAQRKR